MHMFISTGAASGHHHLVLVHLLSVMIHVVLQQNAYVYNYWSGHYHQVLEHLLCLVIHFVLQQNGYVY
jgi:hypothetical protein